MHTRGQVSRYLMIVSCDLSPSEQPFECNEEIAAGGANTCGRQNAIINPRRACARVTVLVLSVCLSLCVFSLFWHLAQSGVQTAVSATSARYGHEI